MVMKMQNNEQYLSHFSQNYIMRVQSSANKLFDELGEQRVRQIRDNLRTGKCVGPVDFGTPLGVQQRRSRFDYFRPGTRTARTSLVEWVARDVKVGTTVEDSAHASLLLACANGWLFRRALF